MKLNTKIDFGLVKHIQITFKLLMYKYMYILLDIF